MITKATTRFECSRDSGTNRADGMYRSWGYNTPGISVQRAETSGMEAALFQNGKVMAARFG
jgi:hypothetical protein